MHRFILLLTCYVGLFVVSTALTIPETPDGKEFQVKSRGSGTGAISFGYALVVLMALALFIFLMGVILCYKREKGIRSEEKTIFLTRF